VENCLFASSKENDYVLDPFTGSGTTGIVACRQNRKFVGIELVSKYQSMAQKRIDEVASQSSIFDMINVDTKPFA